MAKTLVGKTTPRVLILFIISLIFSCGQGVDLIFETIPPSSPYNLAVSGTASEEITLQWEDNAYDRDGYIVERSTDSDDYEKVATVRAGQTTYTDTGLVPNTRYNYRLLAYIEDVESGYSAPISVTTYPPLLAHWKMDGNFNDEQGLNNASPSGDFSYSGGTDGSCPTFDWTNYARVDSPEDFDKDMYTITAWVQCFIHRSAPYVFLDNAIDLHIGEHGKWYASFEQANGWHRDFYSGHSLTENKWYHLSVVCSRINNKVKMYIDGTKVYEYKEETPSAPLWAKNCSRIVFGEYWRQRRWNGTMDDIRVYNGAFADDQVQSLYNSYTNKGEQEKPAQPQNLQPLVVSSSEISLSWDDVSNEAGYKIFRSENRRTFYEVGNTLANVTSFSDTNLNPGTPYYYRVIAFNNVGDSEYADCSATTANTGDFPALLAHWTFDGTVDDASGMGNHAAIYSYHTVDFEPGITGLCPTFDRSNIMHVPNMNGFNKNIYTISAWLRRYYYNTGDYINFHGSFRIGTTSEGALEISGENSMHQTLVNYKLPLSEWTHVTIVLNRSSKELVVYINGDENILTYEISPWVTDPDRIVIGENYHQYRWTGNIDDMKIFGGELSKDQARALYDTYTIPALTAPDAVTNLVSRTVSAGEIQLTWDNTRNEAGYRIYRSEDGISYTEIGENRVNITSFTDWGLSPQKTYYYRVTAFNHKKDSPYHESSYTEVSGTTPISGTQPSLLAHWTFDNTLNDVTLKNHAAARGEAIQYSTGVTGLYAQFNGTNSAFVLHPAGFTADAYTITAWVRHPEKSSAPYIYFGDVARVEISSSGTWSFNGNTGTGEAYSGYNLPPNEWHHLTMVMHRSREKVLFYVDGEFTGEEHAIKQWIHNPGFINIAEDYTNRKWSGSLDDVRIYDGALSAARVEELYTSYGYPLK
ncbi:MAG: hypothetical protein GY754_44055 [bacterium]|nr:hypothetical protein [bacterium]